MRGVGWWWVGVHDGNRDSLSGAASSTKAFPAPHVTSAAAYVAHLSHDGLLLLAEVVLVVLGKLLVQVLVHLQDLSGREMQTTGEKISQQLGNKKKWDFDAKVNLGGS